MVFRRRTRLTQDGYKASKGNGDRGDGIEAARLVGKTYLYNGFVVCEDMAPGAQPTGASSLIAATTCGYARWQHW